MRAVVAEEEGRVLDDRIRHAASGEDRGLGAELAGELHDVEDARALLHRQALQARRLHVHRGPVDIELLGEACGAAHHVLRPVRGADAAQEVLARLPHRLVRAVLLHLVLDDVGGAPERDLAQREEAPLAEERRGHAFFGFPDVHLAFAQPREQLVGGHVHHHRLVGDVEKGIGNGFRLVDAADLADDVVQALQVLHRHRGVDVDAVREELVGVVPALRVA